MFEQELFSGQVGAQRLEIIVPVLGQYLLGPLLHDPLSGLELKWYLDFFLHIGSVQLIMLLLDIIKVTINVLFVRHLTLLECRPLIKLQRKLLHLLGLRLILSAMVTLRYRLRRTHKALIIRCKLAPLAFGLQLLGWVLTYAFENANLDRHRTLLLYDLSFLLDWCSYCDWWDYRILRRICLLEFLEVAKFGEELLTQGLLQRW